MVKRILVIGKNGQLGSSIKKISNNYACFKFEFAGRKELDLSETPSIDRFFNKKKFDIVINCAAYTNVDKAESEPNLAEKVNHLAVEKLAATCKAKGARLIHISTDYVFSGENFRPYGETSDTGPINIYGKTKLDGEKAILEIGPQGVIIRTSWVYSEWGNNFVKTMIRLGLEEKDLKVISDQIGGPTYAGDLALSILTISQHPFFWETRVNPEIYHFSNAGVASWFDFAKSIFEMYGIECNVTQVEGKNYPSLAQRPYYSLLNTTKIRQDFNIEAPYWKESLNLCLDNMKNEICYQR